MRDFSTKHKLAVAKAIEYYEQQEALAAEIQAIEAANKASEIAKDNNISIKSHRFGIISWQHTQDKRRYSKGLARFTFTTDTKQEALKYIAQQLHKHGRRILDDLDIYDLDSKKFIHWSIRELPIL